MYLVIYYLLAGTVVGFSLECVVRKLGNQNINGYERFNLIVFWPIMFVIFIVMFIVGIFKGKDE